MFSFYLDPKTCFYMWLKLGFNEQAFNVHKIFLNTSSQEHTVLFKMEQTIERLIVRNTCTKPIIILTKFILIFTLG